MKNIIGILTIVVAWPLAATAQDKMASVPWGQKFFVKDNPPPIIVHDFGVVPRGTLLTHRFEMENIYATPMQIMADPKPECGCVTVVRYTQKMEPRERGFIDIQLDTRKIGSDGTGAKMVTIPVYFGPKYTSQAILQVKAFSRGDVSLNPGQIHFGVVPQGSTVTPQVVDLQYAGKQADWVIREVDTNNAPVDVSIKVLERTRGKITYRMTTSLKKEAPPGLLQELIYLKTNDPTTPVIPVSVGGSIQPALSVVQGTEQKLDPVFVGESTSRKLMLKGNTPFRILKVEGEANGLTVEYNKTPTPLPIQIVTINFKPTVSGLLRQQLTIRTDQRDPTIVTVEGEAKEPEKTP